MIITRYIIWETIKTQIVLLFFLLGIFFFQKLIKILTAVVNADIPSSVVFTLLGYGLPQMMQFILPISLFLSILITLGRFHANNEMIAMFACGLDQKIIIKTVLILALGTAMLTLLNTFWLSPWSSSYADLILAEAKANPIMSSLVSGRFQFSNNSRYVMYIGSVHSNNFKNIFLVNLDTNNENHPAVIVANDGYVEMDDTGSQKVLLQEGRYYEGNALEGNFRIVQFKKYEAVIGYQAVNLDSSKADQADILTLWQSDNVEFRAEFHWYLTLSFSVFIMALIAIPLGVVDKTQGNFMSMLPAMLLYLIFFLLQIALRSYSSKNHTVSLAFVWLVNIGYFLLAIILNIRDKRLMLYLREKKLKGL